MTGDQVKQVMNVFYVMEFKTNIHEYEQIVEACRCEGIFVSRAYSDDMNNLYRIIYNGLGEADAVIADISTDNKNVWYELGLLHGIGKQFIMISKGIKSLPFDTSIFKVIDLTNPAFANDVVSRLKIIQDTSSPFTEDNPFLWAFDNSSFKRRLSFAHGSISKVGAIEIQEYVNTIQVTVTGRIEHGLTQIIGTRVKYLAIGCSLNKWGWKGRDRWIFRRIDEGWQATIRKNVLMLLLYKRLSNQFRFSIYARTINGECIYLDLEKFYVRGNYLRDDGYSGKVLMINI
jgi:hypothetical protein